MFTSDQQVSGGGRRALSCLRDLCPFTATSSSLQEATITAQGEINCLQNQSILKGVSSVVESANYGKNSLKDIQ